MEDDYSFLPIITKTQVDKLDKAIMAEAIKTLPTKNRTPEQRAVIDAQFHAASYSVTAAFISDLWGRGWGDNVSEPSVGPKLYNGCKHGDPIISRDPETGKPVAAEVHGNTNGTATVHIDSLTPIKGNLSFDFQDANGIDHACRNLLWSIPKEPPTKTPGK